MGARHVAWVWGALCLFVVWLGGGGGAPAEAQETSTLSGVELHANINTVEVVASLEGDDDGDAALQVFYRPSSGGAELEGHRFLDLGGGTFTTALFYLQESTEYTVRIVLDDPDNGGPLEETATTTTRPGVAPAATGETIHVDDATGDDGNPGTQSEPVATISRGLELATAGDTVLVKPGVYYESLSFPQGGQEGAPLVLEAEGPGVVLSGAYEGFLDPSNPPVWEDLHDGIYWTDFPGMCTYLAADDERIYDYASLEDLEEENGNTGIPGALAGGFFVDEAQGRLYLRLPDRSHPGDHTIYAAVREVGLLMDSLSHIHVRGLAIQHFSEVGVDVRHSAHCFVEQNHIHHVGAGVRVRRTESHANTVQDNILRDTSVYYWPWDSCKGDTCEASGISVTGGRDNVVRRNQIQGFFNGVYTGAWDTTDLAIARNTDVYENVLFEVGDDGLEPEGACVNHKFFENAIAEVHNAISLAPIETGPTWLLRNVVVHYTAHALKLNNGSTGHMLVYHNTTVPHPAVDSAQPLSPTIPFGGFWSRNNLWTANRYVIEYMQSTLAGVVDMDYDNLFTTNADGGQRFVKWMDVRYADLAELQAGTDLEPNGFSLEPTYEDPESGDYTLTSDSPLLNAGQILPGINAHLHVDGPDLGAFERGGIQPGPDDGGVSWPDAGTPPTDAGPSPDGASSEVDAGGNGSGGSGSSGCSCTVGPGRGAGSGGPTQGPSPALGADRGVLPWLLLSILLLLMAAAVPLKHRNRFSVQGRTKIKKG